MSLSKLLTNRNYYFSIIKEEWINASDSFPDYLSEITQDKKENNEQYLNSSIDKIKKQIKRFHAIPILNHRWKRKTLLMFEDFMLTEDILSVHQHISATTMNKFQDEIMYFIQEVRNFAPELAFEDIGQAARNYIVYVMFKEMHNESSGFNKAAFGYSMLYPFTDNYIDNKSITSQDKKNYNQLIYDQIKGKVTNPNTEHEQKTCELIKAIESIYSREDKAIYDLLLMMLDAQEYSLQQQNKNHPLTNEERLDISIYKGGISVLIDRYFVNKDLTEKDIIFYLGFGFFLQLADDLQDIKEDQLKGHSTLLTFDTNFEAEEKLVNKMIHFLNNLMSVYHPDNTDFKDFVLSSSYLLIFSSVVGSKEFFSQSYLHTINTYLPFNQAFLNSLSDNKIENMDIKSKEMYMNRLDELLKKRKKRW